MTEKQEGSLAIASAILVIFTAMLNPIISVILSGLLLIIYGVYKFKPGGKQK